MLIDKQAELWIKWLATACHILVEDSPVDSCHSGI